MQDERGRVVGVVDDDVAVCDSLRFLLEAAGHRVVAFQSAEQFLAAADVGRFNCLLLDQHMPQISGLELLQRLRRSERAVPVALMTGSPSTVLTEQALASGATAVLEKPLAEQQLFAFIEAGA